ncbi:aspartate--tRNA ligase, mitochondrial isoform X1 [Culex quinquefasciatus]|uniref:aspartate--tRNA ligase, mitochondrial isoform X1 n=2 Tax=Culex quinquefasciatus TaxID=7176 RepID=UPI0018E396DB|nr:aspartate--tRNA ligase, mitochondrial isoform X1 [Culex quinquefasciatus]
MMTSCRRFRSLVPTIHRLLLAKTRPFRIATSASSVRFCSAAMEDVKRRRLSLGNQLARSSPKKVSCSKLNTGCVGDLVMIEGDVVESRDSGRFLDIVDTTGSVRLTAPNSLRKQLAKMHRTDRVTVVGRVRARPDPERSEGELTGDIEVLVERIVGTGRDSINLSEGGYAKVEWPEGMSALDVTEQERGKCSSESILEYFRRREYTCAVFRRHDIGRQVHLVGWLEDGGHPPDRMMLRDSYGAIQLRVSTIPEEQRNGISENAVILATGTIRARPTMAQGLPTGTVEVYVDELEVLDPNKPYENPVSTRRLNINRFTDRTHNCGQLRASHAGQKVTLCGWLEYVRMNMFFTLRDGYGSTQVVVPETVTNAVKLDGIPFESILKVTGTVVKRPYGQENGQQATGEIEVIMDSVEVLNPARSRLPIDIQEHNQAKEFLRIEHRYIDLRSAKLQHNLRLRSQIIMKMREFMINRCGFIEVETPTLFRRTPGGAQEFVVPTRKPDHFYSLVQSPQQFKQMLMSGAIDRYFQVARCYRDEATRPDRQPEFTQLDLELSFTDRHQIMSLVEGILDASWPNQLHPLQLPFPRMTYQEAMSRYGCDKPDTRFGLDLRDLTTILSSNEKMRHGVATPEFGAFAIVAKPPNGNPKTFKTALTKVLKEYPRCKFAVSVVSDSWTESSIVNLFGVRETAEIKERLKLGTGDLMLLGYGKASEAQEMMGRVRLALYTEMEERNLRVTRSVLAPNFVWIVDFPMFAANEETGQLETVHHPFTTAHPEDMDKLRSKQDLASIRSQSFDLVWNGMEIGGGSVRIHEAALQRMVLNDILQIEHSHLQHLLDALDSGCPPHGGFAIGLDRYISLICRAKSIREVIAFPKTINGKDPLSKAPVRITDEEKRLYHIRSVEGEGVEEERVES